MRATSARTLKRGVYLFLATRRIKAIIAAEVLLALGMVACGPLAYSLNPSGGYKIVAASQLPIIAAVLIQSASFSPLSRKENAGARSTAPWRCLYVLLVTSTGSVLFGVAAVALQPVEGVLLDGHQHFGPVSAVRNLLAFEGAGFIAAAILGPVLAWIAPLTWAIAPLLLYSNPLADTVGLITLASQPDDAWLAFLFALVIWVLGVNCHANSWTMKRY